MMRAVLAVLFLIAVTGGFAAASDPFADTVVSYTPGEWNGSAGYLNPASALGAPTAVCLDGTVVRPDYAPYGPREVVTLGKGGSIILGFDEPIVNDPNNPYGLDLIVFGNSFFYGGNRYSESATVFVSANGADFFRLTTGFADFNPTNGEAMLAAGSGVTFDPGDGSFMDGLYTLQPKADGSWGPFLPDPDPTDNVIPSWSVGGDAFDLSDAVDANGAYVRLDQISYVMIVGGADCTSEVDSVVDVMAVPEPSSMLMAGFMLIGVAAGLRKRR